MLKLIIQENTINIWLQAPQTGSSEQTAFFSTRTGDHTLLRIINIWAFGLLYLPPNEKQRSALGGLASFRQWKTQRARRKKKKECAWNNLNHLCAQGMWELCRNKLVVQKLRWCPTCWCGIKWPFAKWKAAWRAEAVQQGGLIISHLCTQITRDLHYLHHTVNQKNNDSIQL